MNTSSDAAEQIVRLYLEGFEVAARITGAGAKDVGALIYATLQDERKTSGKTKLSKMLKSGKDLKVFSIKEDDYKEFKKLAKRYGVTFSDLKGCTKDGMKDVIVYADDAPRINRIVERIEQSKCDEEKIREEIEETKSKKQENDKGVETKTIDDQAEDERKTEPIKKDKKNLNPHLAKTVKDPQSKPSYKTQKISEQGTKKNRPSVKLKLEKIEKSLKKVKISKSKSEKQKKTKNEKNKSRTSR